ncbi:MAG: 3-deoxy-8-phosphooctulonate synthase [Planctomycetota bacterium]|jgi:2-dehydro-3-deoxyphosphooctonate aldolase (KDO 8-P synthase)|nr:3-deoxy-8-phosphooctulonate synthase [Planctomycetota bacterium]
MTAPTQKVHIGHTPFGGGSPLALIAGPCVIENRDHAMQHAEMIRDICAGSGTPLVFKSSYDKANRSSIDSFRGLGIDEGLDVLAEIRRDLNLPVLTDVHTQEQAKAAGEVVDCLQIPAFLCRQTDLLLAAAATGRAVNVKKGQFMAPGDMANVVAKLRTGGAENVLITERGTSFGYQTLIVDFAGFPVMRASGQPLIFDATHSVQQPGARGSTTGGDRTKVPYLARAAVACGVDGLFLEVHENPDQAPSDGPNMVPMSNLADLLADLLRIDAALRGN